MGKVFIINDDGSKREVLNIQELQELARQGAVLPETKIEAKGRVVNAGKIKELTGVFIATRIRRQNAEKAGGAAVNDAPEVNGSSLDAFEKALEEFGSGAPADTALPPAADTEVKGALYSGEMVIPEKFKPKPEAVKKAKQKPDDAFEAFQAKYNLLVVDDKELEDAVNAKHQRAIKNIDAVISTLDVLYMILFYLIFISAIGIVVSFLEGSAPVVGAVVSAFVSIALLTKFVNVLLRAFLFAKDSFTSRCKESLIQEIYLSKLLRKNGE